jgi:hypothetical protein
MKAWILVKKENFNSYENRHSHEEAEQIRTERSSL